MNTYGGKCVKLIENNICFPSKITFVRATPSTTSHPQPPFGTNELRDGVDDIVEMFGFNLMSGKHFDNKYTAVVHDRNDFYEEV